MHRLVHCILWGTLLSAGVVLAPGVEAQNRAVVLQSAVWDTPEIPVCWENPADAPLNGQGRQWTREAVQEDLGALLPTALYWMAGVHGAESRHSHSHCRRGPT